MSTHTELPLAPAASAPYFWYSTQPVEVQINGGSWVTATSAVDPNGVAAWEILMAGPEVTPVPAGAQVLKYGRNRVAARIAGSSAVVYDGPGGWDIFVGSPGFWASPYDPLVYSAIVSGASDPEFQVPAIKDWSVELALKVAQDLLAALTGNRFHPAGETTEDFRAVPVATRLNPNYQPIKQVVSLVRQPSWTTDTVDPIPVSDYRIIGPAVHIRPKQPAWDVCGTRETDTVLRLTYRFGSTITPAARSILLYLARQLWVADNPDAGDCELPDRITSISREGLSYTILDDASYLEKGKLGVPKVDRWLASVNPAGSRVTPGVYTPSSPPGVHANRLQ